jgi:hypothetical protein
MRIALVALCLAILAAACTPVLVENLGDGRHSLTVVAPSGGYSGSHEEAIEQANAYCARSHETAVIGSFLDQPGVGPRGEHTSRILFTCATPAVLQF